MEGETGLDLVPQMQPSRGPARETPPEMMQFFQQRLTPFADDVTLTQEFGHSDFAMRSGLYGEHGHPGLDLAVTRGDTSITAPFSGHAERRDSGARGYGKHVILIGESGEQIILAHLADFAIQEGPVRAGTVIGRQGDTGTATGPHLHFEWRDAQGRADDPTWFAIQRQQRLEQGLLDDPEGFALGGYTGDGYRYARAGSVHRGEYVMHQLATQRHRSVLEQMHRGADEESLIQALQQQQGQREPGSQGGEMLVRFEFNGDVPVRVTGSPQQAASSLQDHLTHAMQRWATVQMSPWNSPAKRG